MSSIAAERRYGVLGSGVVAQTLAKGLKKHGYDVRIASRDGSKLEKNRWVHAFRLLRA